MNWRGEKGILKDAKKEALKAEPELRFDIMAVPLKGYMGATGVEILESLGMQGYSLKAVSGTHAFLERSYT